MLQSNSLIGRLASNDKLELVIARGWHGCLALYRSVGEIEPVLVLMALRAQRAAGLRGLDRVRSRVEVAGECRHCLVLAASLIGPFSAAMGETGGVASVPESCMGTTTIRLTGDLMARIGEAAQRAGTTSHNFILEAIAETANSGGARCPYSPAPNHNGSQPALG